MLKKEILEIVVKVLDEFDTNPEIDLFSMDVTKITFEDLMLDSLDTLEFAMSLEETMKIELEISEFPQDATISEFLDYLSSLKN